MQCSQCSRAAAIYHVTEVFGGGRYGEVHLCEQCGTAWGQTECQQPLPEITNRERPLRRDGAARFVVARVIISEVHDQQVIMLQEAGGVRLFPLVSGILESTALDRVIKSLTAPRPLAHDAWIATIRALSGEVQDVLVTDLREFIYYANLRIRRHPPEPADKAAILNMTGPRPVALAPLVEVDMRPSDAFILAVKLDVPILIKEVVLQRIYAPPETGFREGPPRPRG